MLQLNLAAGRGPFALGVQLQKIGGQHGAWRLVQSNVAEDIHLAIVVAPGRIAMQHPVLMPQHHIPNQALRLGDGRITQDVVCREDLDGLGV